MNCTVSSLTYYYYYCNYMNGLTKECKKTTTPISASCEEDKLQRYVHVFVNLTRSHLFHELPSLVPTLHPYK